MAVQWLLKKHAQETKIKFLRHKRTSVIERWQEFFCKNTYINDQFKRIVYSKQRFLQTAYTYWLVILVRGVRIDNLAVDIARKYE